MARLRLMKDLKYTKYSCVFQHRIRTKISRSPPKNNFPINSRLVFQNKHITQGCHRKVAPFCVAHGKLEFVGQIAGCCGAAAPIASPFGRGAPVRTLGRRGCRRTEIKPGGHPLSQKSVAKSRFLPALPQGEPRPPSAAICSINCNLPTKTPQSISLWGVTVYRGACLILAYLLGYWAGVAFTLRSTITA